jgi:hypothetical protein
MTSLYSKALVLALCLVSVPLAAQVTFVGTFAEPADGGNLDVSRSTFDGSVAYLVPRGHESEALGSGNGARRWRNMLFAVRGVQGKIVTFHLPARPAESGIMVHNMDSATLNLLEPVWSYDNSGQSWKAFTVIDVMKPDAADTPGATFPADSVVDNSGSVVVSPTSSRREDYGWVFRNATPFTEDVVYISINEHYPVNTFYRWLEEEVFTHPWVAPTVSGIQPGSFVIGHQSGATSTTGAFARSIPETPLYGFQIKDPTANPTKVVVLASGQHPYEGQTKAAVEGAIQWILDPHDPAAAAYRAEYITLVYPLINPTGELAGLWRGTAAEPRRDINRNWNTTRTDPLSDRGIDTVIIHKQAMQRDVAALNRGQPYAVVDVHQNYGDQLPSLHYVLHNTNALASTWVQRLRERIEDIADIVSNTTTSQTLRGFWQFAGAGMTLTIERSTYSTLQAERDFGREMMRAFVSTPAATPALPVATPFVDSVAAIELPTTVAATPAAMQLERRVEDRFSGVGSLHERRPDVSSGADASWSVELGHFTVNGNSTESTDAVARAFIDAGTIDAVVQSAITLQTPGGSAGLVLRALDRENFHFFRVQSGGWSFGRVTQNTATTLASGSRTIPVGLSQTLRAEVVGNTVILQINGQPVYSGSIVAEPSSTRFGLSSGTPGAFTASSFELYGHRAVTEGSEGGDTTPVAPAITGPTPLQTITDRFSGSGTLAGRVPDATVGAPAWTLALGAFDVIDGVAVAGEGNTARAFVDTQAVDARVKAEIRLDSASAFAGLVLRATDRDNFHYFRLQPHGWVFGRVVDNTAYPIATGRRSFAVGTVHTLQADCLGGNVVLQVNGQVVHSSGLPADAHGTRFGLGSGSAYPFTAYSFQVDAGGAFSIGGEGADTTPAVEPPRAEPPRWRGPAGRPAAAGRRLHSISTARTSAVDQPI